MPTGIVAAYPVANPGDAYEHGKQWLVGPPPQIFTAQYLGGTPAEHPDRLAAISALTYLSAKVPPTLIIEPERDDFIPARGNYDVVTAAQRAGADVSLVRIPFAHHSFDVFAGSIGDQVKRTIALSYMDDTR